MFHERVQKPKSLSPHSQPTTLHTGYCHKYITNANGRETRALLALRPSRTNGLRPNYKNSLSLAIGHNSNSTQSNKNQQQKSRTCKHPIKSYGKTAATASSITKIYSKLRRSGHTIRFYYLKRSRKPMGTPNGHQITWTTIIRCEKYTRPESGEDKRIQPLTPNTNNKENSEINTLSSHEPSKHKVRPKMKGH